MRGSLFENLVVTDFLVDVVPWKELPELEAGL